MRVEIKPELYRWACERAGLDLQIVASKMPQLLAWDSGEKKPTIKQLEHFADTVHVPIGYLFLNEPPVEQLPIPDFRTPVNSRIGHPSADLLDTIYLCQQRQEWYRDFAVSIREMPYPFIGSATIDDDYKKVAAEIRQTLKFDVEIRKQLSTWEDALRRFITLADDIGILVMTSGVVGNNNRRNLDKEEFRGFVLSDELAPLIFINGNDTKSAQMFTLAHELAHLWLGKTALFDAGSAQFSSNTIEKWCDSVAAEMLVPEEVLRTVYRSENDFNIEKQRLARVYKVSILVIIRRLHDCGYLSLETFRTVYQEEVTWLMGRSKGDGGNFYSTQAARISKRFACAVILNTLEGQTLYRDAFQLLGFSKYETFRELGNRLGVI